MHCCQKIQNIRAYDVNGIYMYSVDTERNGRCDIRSRTINGEDRHLLRMSEQNLRLPSTDLVKDSDQIPESKILRKVDMTRYCVKALFRFDQLVRQLLRW